MSAERLYHVVLINDKTGKRTQISGYPDTHDMSMNLIRANCTNYYRAHKELRLMLEEAK